MPGMLRFRAYLLWAAVIWTVALTAFLVYEASYELGRPGGVRGHLLLESIAGVILWCAGLIALFVAGKRLRSGLEQRNAERRRSESALRESESRYRSLYQTSVAGVYRTTVGGSILDCNDAFARMLGYDEASQLTGRCAVDLYFTPADRESFLERLRREKTLLACELRLKKKDGTPLWVLENVTLVDREVLLGTMIDITEQRSAEDRLRHAEDELRLDRIRMQIAADLHDDIGSTLSSTAIFNSVLQRSLPPGVPDLIALSVHIDDNLRHIQESLHDIVWSVNPANDTLDNTLLRIQEYAAEVMEAQGISVSIQRSPMDGELAIPMQRRRPLFLLMKEAITNVIKHAHCTQVSLGISYDDGRLAILLRDNGQGFDPAGVRGNGLVNMQQRARDLDGHLTVTAEPGKGTAVRLEMALQ